MNGEIFKCTKQLVEEISVLLENPRLHNREVSQANGGIPTDILEDSVPGPLLLNILIHNVQLTIITAD